MKEKEYIISSVKFDGISSAACPLVGQIAVDDEELAYKIYNWLKDWQTKPENIYSIAVSLWKRNGEGKYDAIER